MAPHQAPAFARLPRLFIGGVAIVLVAACGSAQSSPSPIASLTASPSPTVPASPSPSASHTESPSATTSAMPSASTSAGPVACAPADLSVANGQWEGAAGSRGTNLTVQNVSSAPCLIPGRALVALVDADHRQLVASPPDSTVAPLVLSAGESAASDVLVGNVCGPAPAAPVALVVAFLGSTVESTGPPISSGDGLPPCNGPGPATIQTSPHWTRP